MKQVRIRIICSPCEASGEIDSYNTDKNKSELPGSPVSLVWLFGL